MSRKRSEQAKTDGESKAAATATAEAATDETKPSAEDTPPAAWLDNDSRPSYLDDIETDEVSLALHDYTRVPRIGIVQPGTPKSKHHAPGSVLSMPSWIEVAEPGESFTAVPVFFCAEFVAWNDRHDSERPAIDSRSLDSNGEIARRARHHDRRVEKYAGGRYAREFVEHLNFLLVLIGHPRLEGSTLLLDFSRGDFRRGKRFCEDVTRVVHDGTHVPIWAQIWTFLTRETKRRGKPCFEFEWKHEGLVDEAHAEILRGRYERYRDLHRNRRLETADPTS